MNNFTKKIFLEDWPQADLEFVPACPVCHSQHTTMKHHSVRDWSFGTAPGIWKYWSCNECQSLYLNPRPTPESIGKAYANYYTHKPALLNDGLQGLKLRWKNERLSLRLGCSISPRFNLQNGLKTWALKKAQRLNLPFGIEILATLPTGRFMDVGCGSGNIVSLANQLGWQSSGIEIDPIAVKSAQRAGLNVTEGSYQQLIHHQQSFDVILCSHVIEHVYEPLDLLTAIHGSLRPGGLLLLSTPNAQSDVHLQFGPYWRGLEAPRHLSIFSEAILTRLMQQIGFEVSSHSDDSLETVKQSRKIEKLAAKNDLLDKKINKQSINQIHRTKGGHDFIKLSARKL